LKCKVKTAVSKTVQISCFNLWISTDFTWRSQLEWSPANAIKNSRFCVFLTLFGRVSSLVNDWLLRSVVSLSLRFLIVLPRMKRCTWGQYTVCYGYITLLYFILLKTCIQRHKMFAYAFENCDDHNSITFSTVVLRERSSFLILQYSKIQWKMSRSALKNQSTHSIVIPNTLHTNVLV